MTRTQRLQAMWHELNQQWFSSKLRPVPIRITRSRRTYGYFNGPNHRAASASIRISDRLADTPALVRDTMLHEMIHQWLYQMRFLDWDQHRESFQAEHRRCFGASYVEG